MGERVRSLIWRTIRLKSPVTLLAGAVIGFLFIVALNLRPPDPESRLPDNYRLAALIERRQGELESQRLEVENLRTEVEAQRNATLSQRADRAGQRSTLDRARLLAGTVPVRGVGFTVVLADSSLEEAPTGNVNDLVIHSSDVQAVVNALWASGAEAVAINGQRVVGTSAILCVGNTLLLNGTVHSPPYEISAIGASRTAVLNDPLVEELAAVAKRFSLRFSVGREQQIEVPGYTGSIIPEFAAPISG